MGVDPTVSQLNVKAVVAAFNQEKALVGAFSVLTNIRMELQALVCSGYLHSVSTLCPHWVMTGPGATARLGSLGRKCFTSISLLRVASGNI